MRPPTRTPRPGIPRPPRPPESSDRIAWTMATAAIVVAALLMCLEAPLWVAMLAAALVWSLVVLVDDGWK